MRRLTAPRPARRHDGWTPQRQLDFLEILSGTGSVTRSARAVGMSRESAYRLRLREPDGLFAAAWERALTPIQLLAVNKRKVDEGHVRAFAAACGLEEQGTRHRPAGRSTS
ncbi:MAG TPA: hypothetical protein VM531_03915 [Sphingomicrobium sp.]|jgi:hypothetical protein|nr:hypothetical protein [Sphingomicrobium sp.]